MIKIGTLEGAEVFFSEATKKVLKKEEAVMVSVPLFVNVDSIDKALKLMLQREGFNRTYGVD
jgi:hypothetical protein